MILFVVNTPRPNSGVPSSGADGSVQDSLVANPGIKDCSKHACFCLIKLLRVIVKLKPARGKWQYCLHVHGKIAFGRDRRDQSFILGRGGHGALVVLVWLSYYCTRGGHAFDFIQPNKLL